MDDNFGSFSVYRGITDEELETFFRLAGLEDCAFLKVIKEYSGDNDLILMLLDAFAGEKIQFPERKKCLRLLDRSFMYNYLKDNSFSKEAYRTVSKQKDKTTLQIKNMVDVVDRNLK